MREHEIEVQQARLRSLHEKLSSAMQAKAANPLLGEGEVDDIKADINQVKQSITALGGSVNIAEIGGRSSDNPLIV